MRQSEIAIPIHNDIEAKYIDCENGSILNYFKSKVNNQNLTSEKIKLRKRTINQYKRQHGFYYKNRLELNLNNSSCGEFFLLIQLFNYVNLFFAVWLDYYNSIQLNHTPKAFIYLGIFEENII